MLTPVNGDEANPSFSPVPAVESHQAPPPPASVLSVRDVGKLQKEWTLTLHPGHLALVQQESGGPPYVILRDQLMKSAVLMEGGGVFIVQKPIKMTFRLLEKGAVRALADWIGKPVLAGYYLWRRYAMVLPLATIMLVGSLPLPGAAALDPKGFDVSGFILGAMLLASWGAAKWRPLSILFLVDSIWFSVVAVNLSVNVMHGRSKGWLVLVALMAWMAVNGVRHFIRFRGTKIQPFKK